MYPKTFQLNFHENFSNDHHTLYCVECGYMHPDDSGLEEGDLCPECGQGILMSI